MMRFAEFVLGQAEPGQLDLRTKLFTPTDGAIGLMLSFYPVQ